MSEDKVELQYCCYCEQSMCITIQASRHLIELADFSKLFIFNT